MDILWCLGTQMKTWDDLRATFLTANARKAIAPVRFHNLYSVTRIIHHWFLTMLSLSLFCVVDRPNSTRNLRVDTAS